MNLSLQFNLKGDFIKVVVLVNCSVHPSSISSAVLLNISWGILTEINTLETWVSLSTGGKTYRTVSHSVYFVNDSAQGSLTCVYPTAQQNSLQTTLKAASKTIHNNELSQLQKENGYSFLNKKPDIILPQQ